MILSAEGYERVPFPTSGVAHVCSFFEGEGWRRERRPRERENEIASRHAYEIGGGSDIKVVPFVRRGATADKWPEMLAKVGSARQIIFHRCRVSERAKRERERGLST